MLREWKLTIAQLATRLSIKLRQPKSEVVSSLHANIAFQNHRLLCCIEVLWCAVKFFFGA